MPASPDESGQAVQPASRIAPASTTTATQPAAYQEIDVRSIRRSRALWPLSGAPRRPASVTSTPNCLSPPSLLAVRAVADAVEAGHQVVADVDAKPHGPEPYRCLTVGDEPEHLRLLLRRMERPNAAQRAHGRLRQRERRLGAVLIVLARLVLEVRCVGEAAVGLLFGKPPAEWVLLIGVVRECLLDGRRHVVVGDDDDGRGHRLIGRELRAEVAPV